MDLADGMVWLKNSAMRVKVNPVFLKYFATAYKPAGGIAKLVPSGELAAVKVIGTADNLIGLIMPIRG